MGRARVLNERGADPSPLQSSRPEVCGFSQHRDEDRDGAIGRSGDEENVQLDDVARIVRYIGIGVLIAVLLCKDHGRRDRPGGRSPAATRTCSRSKFGSSIGTSIEGVETEANEYPGVSIFSKWRVGRTC